jgi:hypothetical protein
LNKGERGVLMYDETIYSLLALLLAVTFGAIGVVQLIGPRFVRATYDRWGYGPQVRIVTGALDVVAASMLAIPDMRVWGIVLAGLLTFGSVVVFLNHRQYRHALPAIGLLIALVPATVAVPRPAQIQFVVQTEGSEIVTASDDRMLSGASFDPGLAGAERRAF